MHAFSLEEGAATYNPPVATNGSLQNDVAV
jgi:hypothetical protein